METLYINHKNTLSSQLNRKGLGFWNSDWDNQQDGSIKNKFTGLQFMVQVVPVEEERKIKKPIFNSEGKRIYSYKYADAEERREFYKLLETGEEIEITQCLFADYLDALPPRKFSVLWNGKFWFFAYAEGDNPLIYFRKENDKYYCQQNISKF